MRKDIEFNAEGVTLRGWLYLPEDVDGTVPTILMAHGFSAVKEQYLDGFAQAFASSGLGALVFDHRNFGASDGEPRQEIDPIQQIRDYRHAITFARTISEVDSERIGVWGTSYSGGHALVLGAIDRRVKCIVSQVPTISGSTAALRRLRADLVPNLLAAFDTDRENRFAGKKPAKIPVVAEDESTPCALPGQDAWNFFSQSWDRAPSYRNEITLRSAEMAREYEPGVYVPMISPTPLLMIVAKEDWVTPADLALKAFESALQPKKLILLSGGHFVPYVDRFNEASSAAAAWFREHLISD